MGGIVGDAATASDIATNVRSAVDQTVTAQSIPGIENHLQHVIQANKHKYKVTNEQHLAYELQFMILILFRAFTMSKMLIATSGKNDWRTQFKLGQSFSNNKKSSVIVKHCKTS
jgi:hypothetical protein